VNSFKRADYPPQESVNMKILRMNDGCQARKRRTGEQAETRIVILALVCFLMGAAVSAWWFSRKPSAIAASQTDVTAAPGQPANPSPEPQADLAALDAVRRSIPNVNSASLEEGTRILREAALAEFRQAAQELQVRQKKAEQDFMQGQNNQSKEQQQIATKQLQELRAEQVEKLQQIAANSRAQIEALQQLKGAAR